METRKKKKKDNPETGHSIIISLFENGSGLSHTSVEKRFIYGL